MPLTQTHEIVRRARAAGAGVGAFNVLQLEHAQAIVAGAERADRPVVLQISENTVRYHGALEPIALASLALARAAKTPVAVHLDHAENPDLVHEAVELGLGSVMFDAARLPYEENVAATREIVEHCHRHGVRVEAELGEIGGKGGAHDPGVRTDPGEARAFVAATGVDALAVAVGSVHQMVTRDAVLDLDLIARLRAAVDVPLVLHGSSGVPDALLTRAVAAGMTKVNVSTHLNKAFTRAVRDHLTAHPAEVDPRRYLTPARAAVTEAVAHLLGLLDPRVSGRSGRSARERAGKGAPP